MSAIPRINSSDQHVEPRLNRSHDPRSPVTRYYPAGSHSSVSAILTGITTSDPAHRALPAQLVERSR